MRQTPGQTPQPQAAPAAAQAKPPAGAKPQRPPAPEVPPEFDALPIWTLPPAKLIAMVKDSKSTVFQKAIACKKLAFTGGKDAIQPMAALLDHPQLSCYARFGLEPNPDPLVDDVLRASLGKLTGKLQAGVINTIGVRKDVKAMPALTKLLNSSDPEIAGAAAAAIGQIGGLPAAKVLEAALGSSKPPVFPVVAHACLLCAEALMPANKARAIELYNRLSANAMPSSVRLAALRVLNAESPAPPGAKAYPPPTGAAAEADKSGFLGRGR